MSIKYNEFGEVILVNGMSTGQHLGAPMQDAIGTSEENSAYYEELHTITNCDHCIDDNQPTEGEITLQDKTITANGTFTADENYDGLGTVTVDVSGGDDEKWKADYAGMIDRSTAATELPEGITSIGDYAFYACTNLALTALPEGLTSIGNNVFQGCTNLALTALPEGLTSIGNSVFNGCTNLTLTALPEGLTSIGNFGFNSCTNLTLTALPEGLTSIGNFGFNGCTNLTTMTFAGTPAQISSSAFTNCSNLVTINVPWAEGAVAKAPWGATNATINYNYTGA